MNKGKVRPLTAEQAFEIKCQIAELLDRYGLPEAEQEWLINAFDALAEGANSKKLEMLSKVHAAFWLVWQREDYKGGLLAPWQIEKFEALPDWSWETQEDGPSEDVPNGPTGQRETDANGNEWIGVMTDDGPIMLPSDPEKTYSRTGEWRGWCDFLGNDDVEEVCKDMTPEERAREMEHVRRNSEPAAGEGIGCGCPQCAGEADGDACCPRVHEIVWALRELAEDGGLLVFDPDSGMLLSDDDISGVCVNGPSVQVTLSEGWKQSGVDDREVTS